jgi:hypothetical protein
MTASEPKFEELRDIILWQQLNKQLIELRGGGATISESNQKNFQRFCFENNLSHRLTEDPLIDEIPLVLVTDFFEKTIVTLRNKSWTDCLKTLLSDAIILDIELALAGAFDEIAKYRKKYVIEGVESADDDEGADDELYEVIDQYNQIIEEQKRQLPPILNELYNFKASAISELLDRFQIKGYLRQEGGLLSIKFNDASDRDHIWGTYNAEFCEKAIQTFSDFANATKVFKDIAIFGFIDKMKSKPGLKKSILDFLDHENEIQTRQSIFLDDFFSAVRAWQTAPQSFLIKVCETSPFAFLKRPFPEV